MANHERTYNPPFFEGLWQRGAGMVQRWFSEQHRVTRRVMVGSILVLALLAFELFNFDTTQYALEDLLGSISFATIRWATILAIAFCSIDFAGLAWLLTPKDDKGPAPDGRPLKPTWLLLMAWLLGGAMNAVMTWWAVSLALMGHNLGNEVLTREQLLRMVPIFVAVLVWVTRILIISSFTMNADQPLAKVARQVQKRPARPATRSQRRTPARPARTPKPQPVAAAGAKQKKATPDPVYVGDDVEDRQVTRPRHNGKPPRRPTVPRPPRGSRPSVAPMQAKNSPRDHQRMQ